MIEISNINDVKSGKYRKLFEAKSPKIRDGFGQLVSTIGTKSVKKINNQVSEQEAFPAGIPHP